MGNITYRDGISIFELVVYLPLLAASFFLAFKHGFGRSSGWFYLIMFCLIRIVGASSGLATISSPDNSTDYIVYALLQSVALSPLILAALGLLSRVLESIRKTTSTLVTPLYVRLVQIMVTVGLVLGIVGGVDAGDNYSSTGVYQPVELSRVGVILFLVSYVLLAAATAATGWHVSRAEPGEKRVLAAVAVSLPLLLVRVVYALVQTLANPAAFNSITGSPTTLLCMAVLEELAVVLVYVAVGLTLEKVPKHATGHEMHV